MKLKIQMLFLFFIASSTQLWASDKTECFKQMPTIMPSKYIRAGQFALANHQEQSLEEQIKELWRLDEEAKAHEKYITYAQDYILWQRAAQARSSLANQNSAPKHPQFQLEMQEQETTYQKAADELEANLSALRDLLNTTNTLIQVLKSKKTHPTVASIVPPRPSTYARSRQSPIVLPAQIKRASQETEPNQSAYVQPQKTLGQKAAWWITPMITASATIAIFAKILHHK